jgi:hypothetical protein
MSAPPYNSAEKDPGKSPKLNEKARKLPVEDLKERPWATQRVEFLFAMPELGVSEAASLFGALFGAGRYTCGEIRVMSRLYVKFC